LDLRDREKQEDEKIHNEKPNVNTVIKLRRLYTFKNFIMLNLLLFEGIYIKIHIFRNKTLKDCNLPLT